MYYIGNYRCKLLRTMIYNYGILSTFTFIVTFFVNFINAGTYNDTESLYNYLTSSRNKNVRPHTDTTKPTKVYLDFFLINLQEIDAVEGTVSLTGYFQVAWNDPNMAWNRMAYNNIYHLQVPKDTIWIPPLINSNSAKEIKILGINGLLATVVFDGNISWYPGQNLLFACNIDTTYFPFDKQVCDMEVLGWGYNINDVVFKSTFLRYKPSSIMKTVSGNCRVQAFQSQILQYRYLLQRRPTFLVATLVLPAILLSLINIAVFLLPQDSGERIGFSITLLLAVVVYLTIAQGLLPATAKPRLSSIYTILIIDLMMSGFILLSVIISCRIFYKPEVKLPRWIKKLA